jgi:hypothetical protein
LEQKVIIRYLEQLLHQAEVTAAIMEVMVQEQVVVVAAVQVKVQDREQESSAKEMLVELLRILDPTMEVAAAVEQDQLAVVAHQILVEMVEQDCVPL